MRTLCSTVLLCSALAAAEGPEGAPEIIDVQAVTPTTLAVVVQEKRLVRHVVEPYVAAPGDEIRSAGKGTVPVWRDGVIIEEAMGATLWRSPDGKAAAVQIGTISGDRTTVAHEPIAAGQGFDRDRAAAAASWAVTQGGTPVAIAKVSLKSKPNAAGSLTTLHRVYLELAEPLKAGGAYEVVSTLPTRQGRAAFTHESANARSEAVHVSQIGYRPDDPAKHAFLSLWMGTGGAVDYPDDQAFEVIDEASGAVVLRGKAQVAKALGAGERVRANRDFAKTEVLRLDFSAVTKPGTYRIHVPGIGCSLPFPVGKDVWLEATKISLKGLLAHRSGIELKPPLLPYHRPRPMHPADGVKVLPVPCTTLDGESAAIREAVRGLMAAGSLPEPLPQAWGGYMDAGDWDRRSGHLGGTVLLLELYDSAPAFWDKVALDLPEDEQRNRIPDLIDEALWNIDCYGRLQMADGGVRGGIESTEHPRPGEASWQETLVLGAFAPDPVSCYYFAATAAHAGRLIATADPARAKDLQAKAVKAWTWAEANGGATGTGKIRNPNARAWAAAALLHALPTDALASPWQEAYAADNAIARKADQLAGEQALYTYARLPDGIGDATLKAEARAAVLRHADAAMALQAGNAFAIGLPVKDLPPSGFVSYATVPGNIARSLPRAYLLSGDERYLAATIQSCQFGAGANPDNLVFTTGVGREAVRHPLHCDTRILGVEAPPGITVYGHNEPTENQGSMGWVFQWFVGKQSTPNGKDWPMYEAYWDIYVVPQMNEYTVTQTIMPTAYTWGILASRPATP